MESSKARGVSKTRRWAMVAGLFIAVGCASKAERGEACKADGDCVTGACFDDVQVAGGGFCVKHCTCAMAYCFNAPECPDEICIHRGVDPTPQCSPRCDKHEDCPADQRCLTEHVCR